MSMRVPILSTDPNVKRYRYSSLKIGFTLDNMVLRQWFDNPNEFCCRSLEEWTAYFGVEVELMENQRPALIGWTPAEGHND